LLLGVDDSKTMRKVLEITFAGENYRTVFAASANDALDSPRAWCSSMPRWKG
jgi:CheY-like chemotaxis protein